MTDRDPRIDPQPGDELVKDGVTRRVVARGVAGSVRFKKTVRGHAMVGQVRLGCWQRWAREAKPA